jgi:eukaryotic-like serine/threonine-protein kinase
MRAFIEGLSSDPWVPRRKWAAGAAAALLVSSVALAWQWTSSRQAHLCDGGPAQLAGIWDEPQKAAVHARFAAADKAFAVDAWVGTERALDDYARRWVQMRKDACSATRIHREQPESVMTVRMACLDRRLQELQALTDVLARADSKVMAKAVQAANGLVDLKRCADVEALLAQVKPPSDAGVLKAVRAVEGELATARALFASGALAPALEQAARAAQSARETGYSPALAEALDLLGWIEVKNGDPKAATGALDEAEWEAEASHLDAVAVEATARNAYTLGRLARYAEGDREAQHGAALLRRQGGDPMLESELLYQVATLRLFEGRYADGLTQLERAVDLREKALGPESPALAPLLTRLADAAERSSKYDRAFSAAQRAIAIDERALGPVHPDLAEALIAAGDAQRQLDHHEEAHRTYQRALDIREKAFGPNSPDVATTLFGVGIAFIDEGRYRQALPLFQRAEKIYEQAYGRAHPSVANTLGNLAICLETLGQAEEALKMVQEAREIEARANGPDHPGLLYLDAMAADALRDLGRLEESAAALRHALSVADKGMKDSPESATAMNALAEVLSLQGRASEARALAERAHALNRAAHGDGSFQVAGDLNTQSYLFLAEGKYEAALRAARQAREILEPKLPRFHTRLLYARRNEGEAMLDLKDADGAARVLEMALAAAEDPDGSPWDSARIRFVLARAVWAQGTDPARARRLATRAEAEFAALHTRLESGEVRTWLAQHGGAPTAR